MPIVLHEPGFYDWLYKARLVDQENAARLRELAIRQAAAQRAAELEAMTQLAKIRAMQEAAQREAEIEGAQKAAQLLMKAWMEAGGPAPAALGEAFQRGFGVSFPAGLTLPTAPTPDEVLRAQVLKELLPIAYRHELEQPFREKEFEWKKEVESTKLLLDFLKLNKEYEKAAYEMRRAGDEDTAKMWDTFNKSLNKIYEDLSKVPPMLPDARVPEVLSNYSTFINRAARLEDKDAAKNLITSASEATAIALKELLEKTQGKTPHLSRVIDVLNSFAYPSERGEFAVSTSTINSLRETMKRLGIKETWHKKPVRTDAGFKVVYFPQWEIPTDQQSGGFLNYLLNLLGIRR